LNFGELDATVGGEGEEGLGIGFVIE